MEEEKSEGAKREGGGQKFSVLPSAVNHNESQLARQLAREEAKSARHLRIRGHECTYCCYYLAAAGA